MTLGVSPLLRDDEAGFGRALAIYRDAIERTEQKTEAEMRALLARGDYRFLIAVRSGEIVGMAVSFMPPADDFWLFEYAAVAPAERGRGTGAALFRSASREAGNGRTGLIEVDAARRDEPGWELRERRLGFYARLGCRRIEGIDYILPLDAFGPPPPMALLAHAPGSVQGVRRDDVERWLGRIYMDCYAQDADDPRIASMLRGAPEYFPLVGTVQA